MVIDVRDILPESVLKAIRLRYRAGVYEAEHAHQDAAANEDALTGALGALIRAQGAVFVDVGDGRMFRVEMRYSHVRGHGPGAPEKKYGTDGIFQIAVVDDRDGRRIVTKGLPFQAKSKWSKRDVLRQAQAMDSGVAPGIVVEYLPGHYSACLTRDVLAHGGSKRAIVRSGSMHALGELLAGDFLDCTVGTRGLFYDGEHEVFATAPSDLHIMTTEVLRMRDVIRASDD